jgi:uncharacterized protein (TIGR02246 family)
MVKLRAPILAGSAQLKKEISMIRGVLGMGAVLVLIASLVSAQGQDPQASSAKTESLEDVRRAIDQGNAQWSEGWAKRDAARVAALFAEDGVQLAGSGKIITGPKEIAERQKAAMMGVDPGVKVTVTTKNVWRVGDTAYETGQYRYEYTEKGKPGVDEGQYVTVWKRQKDGAWKLAMDMGLPGLPPAPKP